MSFAKPVLAFAAALALTGSPAGAEQRQFGNLIYQIPQGWDAPIVKNGLVWLGSDLPNDRCEYCRLLIGPEAAKSGSLTDWLTKQRLTMVDEDERDEWRVSRPAKQSGGNDRFPTAILGQTDGNDLQLLIAIEAGDRYFLIGFEGDSDEEDLKETLATASSTLMPWLAGMQYRSAGAKPLLGAPQAGDLNGLWWGWRMDQTVGIDGMMKMENNYRRLVFWPDGTFYDGTPPQGLKAPDRAALDTARDLDWGNYAQSGNRLTLSFADGRTEVLTRDGDGWKDEDQTLHAAEPMPDGTRINGKLEWINFTGFAPGTGTGGVGGGGETIFHPDGRYEGSSSGGGFGSFETGGSFAVNSKNQRGGTYEVRDGLVIFTPSQGKGQTAEMVFRTDGDELMVGDDFLKGTVKEGG